MRPSQYLAIAVRIFSILLFLYGVRQSSFVIGLIGDGDTGVTASWAFAITSALLPIVVSIVLWCFPCAVANAIVKPEINDPIEPMGAQSVLTVLVLAIGLYALYYAIIDAVYWATLWQMAERSGDMEASFYLGPENKANMVATAVELFISVVILMKARSVAHRMLRITE